MLLLLPPSETKTRPAEAGARGPGVASSPELDGSRAAMLDAVRRTAGRSDAADLLGVPRSALELVGRMRAIDREPAAPVLDVYSGVLYDQLAGAPWPSADRQVCVQSALFGLVDAAQDRIPAYRVSAASRVDGLGGPGRAGTWWRPRLEAVARALMERTGALPSSIVVDCRSGAYRAMMPLPATPGVTALEVRPVRERAGRRTVISHDAKRWRGWAVRALLADPRPVPDAAALAALLADRPGAPGIEVDEGARTLTLVERV